MTLRTMLTPAKMGQTVLSTKPFRTWEIKGFVDPQRATLGGERLILGWLSTKPFRTGEIKGFVDPQRLCSSDMYVVRTGPKSSYYSRYSFP